VKVLTDDELKDKIKASICLGGVLGLLLLGFGLFIFGVGSLRFGLIVLLGSFVLGGLFL